MTGAPRAGDALDVRHLRSAIEYAVLIAREGQKLKPPLAHPPGFKKYLRMQRIPAASLSALRRMIDADDEFRSRIARGAVPDLVDEIGRVWLERPAGWEDRLRRMVSAAEAAEDDADAERRLRRAEKRREAAEHATARARAELVVLQEELVDRDAAIEGLRNDVAKMGDEVEALRAELADTRIEARHARDREQAAVARLAASESARADALEAQGRAEVVRDEVLADRAVLSADRSELARLAAAAESLAARLASLAAPPASGAPVALRRTALPLPGGVLGDSDAAAEYLLRSGASVVVDGYNVAKLAWPDLDLADQRAVLLDAVENLVRRFGSDVTVVFDGADVVGASADGRRIVRVVYSPAGVIADDVIRDEVRRLPATRPVVVVTSDQAIVRDVRAMGANTVASAQLVSLMR